jgi:hypothetical protein
MDEVEKLIKQLKSSSGYDVGSATIKLAAIAKREPGNPDLFKAISHLAKEIYRPDAMSALLKIFKQNPNEKAVADSIPILLDRVSFIKSLKKRISLLLMIPPASVVSSALVVALRKADERKKRAILFMLHSMFEKCYSKKKVNNFEQLIHNTCTSLLRETSNINTSILYQLSTLRLKAIRKKNEFSKDKGVLLDDKPKAPKKGRIYQQSRRVRNG